MSLFHLVGVVSMIIPIVNMISISVPKESTAVGLGMNTMLRNLGGAIGPVLATTILSTYTTPIVKTINGHPIVVATFGNSTAFNTIFATGIAINDSNNRHKLNHQKLHISQPKNKT